MKSIDKSTIMIIVLTLMSKILAILRQSVLTFCFGASKVTDAFVIAQSIPNTLFSLVVAAIGISFIPEYNRLCRKNGNHSGIIFTNRVFQAVLFLALLFVFIVLIFTKQFVFLFASGFDKKTFSLTCSFVRISIFSLLFIGGYGVFSSYLKAKKCFFFATITGVAISLVEILSCFIALNQSVMWLAYGITIATFIQFLIVFFASLNNGFSLIKDLHFFDTSIKRVILLSVPLFVSYGIDEINIIIDRTIASSFDNGSVSILNYSSNIVSLVNSVITVSFYTVLFSEVSKYVTNNDEIAVKKSITETLKNTMLLLIPATVGLMVYSKPIISLILERGSFTSKDTTLTAISLCLYALSIIPNGIRMITQTYFYSYGKTKFCMYVGIGAVIINIIGNIILSKIWGIFGLAISSSVGVMFSSAIHYIFFKKKYRKVFDSYDLKIVYKIVINTIVMIIVSYLFYYYVDFINEKIRIIPTLIIAIIIYGFMSMKTKVVDVNLILRFIKR